MGLTRKQKTKTYEIHDNGGRPYSVDVTGNSVAVSKNMDTFKRVDGKFIDIHNPPKHLFTVKADEIFIGAKSPKGGYDGLKPSEAKGNTILLALGSKYMYIGSEIYEFTPVKGDTIVNYYSNIGNNDVPYPYAIGKTHVYILLDKTAVDKSYFDMTKDIYDQYYYKDNIHMCLVGNPKSDLCKEKEVYQARIKEFDEKKRKLKTRKV